jgi:hypothetical protein
LPPPHTANVKEEFELRKALHAGWNGFSALKRGEEINMLIIIHIYSAEDFKLKQVYHLCNDENFLNILNIDLIRGEVLLFFLNSASLMD